MNNRQGWGTWQPDRPAELQHLATGLSLTPTVYSDRAQRFSSMPPNKGFEYGVRSIDSTTAQFTTCLEQTVIDWRYIFGKEDDVTIDWHAVRHGEWGLRFWISIVVQGPRGCDFVYDRDDAALRGRLADSNVQLEIRCAKAPLLVTFHENLSALGEEFEQHGYFYLASRGTHGRVAALRFNLEEAPSMRVNASWQVGSRPSLPSPPAVSTGATTVDGEPFAHTGSQASLQAIHDVMAWNHVFDGVNKRPYTCLTRNWNTQKFGGFGVWMNDILYNALLWSLFDVAKAKQNIEAVFAWQTEDGNFPCLVTGNDQWLDRSQPPIAAYVVWHVFQRCADLEFLGWAYPRLLRNYDWWWRRRVLADTGLVAYGTSLDVGDGLYKGTKLAAKDESSMDNMPVHDEAPFNESTGMLESNDVGLNSLLAIDAEVLTGMAQRLGFADDASRLQSQWTAHKARIGEYLWDTDRGVFANRLLNGEFVDALAPTSFYPLAAGIASASQTEAMIGGYLTPRHKFGGDYGLPSVTRDHPAYHDNVYWRGRIWAPLNYWVYQGLTRAGRNVEANDLADMSARLFDSGWRDRRCGENYHAETGAVDDQADTDWFYSWGALLPAMTVAGVNDVTPWHGLTLNPSQVVGELGPVVTPLGGMSFTNGHGGWCISLKGRPWLQGNLVGLLSLVEQTADKFTARLPETTSPMWLAFMQSNVIGAKIDQQVVDSKQDKVMLGPGGSGRTLSVRFQA